MSITVVNIRKEDSTHYVGRPTPCGNIFVMKNESERNQVCDDYQIWFDKQVNSDNRQSKFLSQLRAIYVSAKKGDVKLGCYCAPKRCHADTIKAFIEEQLSLVED
jgi:hypothetical protein